MCGQCGALAEFLTAQEVNLFSWNLRMNIFRGRDSTGVAAVTKPEITYNKGKKTRVKPSRVLAWKEPRNAWEFLYFNDLDKKEVKKSIFQGEQKRLLMGHCRAATIGKVNGDNAHPFLRGSVLGMHNGTIRKKFKGHAEFETDSEAFFELINTIGIKDAIQEVEALDTAYAIQYFDKSKGTFNIIRNDRRPLVLVYSSSKQALFWSSEEDDLRYSAKKIGVNLESAVITPEPYMLYTFDMTGTDPHKKIEKTDLTPKKISYTHTPSTGKTYSGGAAWANDPYSWEDGTYRYYYSRPGERYDMKGMFYEYQADDDSWSRDYSKKKAAKTYTSALTDSPDVPIGKEEQEMHEAAESIAALHNKKLKEVNSHSSVYYGFNGRALTHREFSEKLLHGCANCSRQPDINDPAIEYVIGWHDDRTFFCEDCMEDDTIASYLVKHQNKRPDAPWEEDGQEGTPEGDI